MVYNNKFISDYDEEAYLKFLSDENLLVSLFKNYNYRYNDSGKVNGNFILFQESLDEYVIRRIKIAPDFVLTEEFKKYKEYLINCIASSNNSFFFHNKFIHAFNKDELIKFLGVDNYNKIYQSNIKKIDIVKKINQKIEKNEKISQQELNVICDVYAFNRDINNKYHKNLIEYIFNNLTDINSNLTCNSFVLDAILSYIPKVYPKKDGYNANNSRIVADDVNVKGPGISHGESHVFINRDLFKNIDFKSIDNIKKTYVKRGDDFTFLLIVANHELSHQYQTYMLRKNTFSNSGFMMLKKQILNSELKDYSTNHNNDDIEVDATEIGWEVCAKFYDDFIKNNDLRNKLVRQSYLNKQGTADRRFDYCKFDQKTKTISDTPFYDISNLNDIVFRKPEYIQKYPMLKTFYDNQGNLSLEFLKKSDIGNTSVGADYISYMCLYFPNKVMNELKNFNGSDIEVALNNIFYGFSRYSKKIVYFDYDKRNNLSGEYRKIGDKDEKLKLLKSYKKAMNLYGNIVRIISNEEIRKKYSAVNDFVELFDRKANFITEQYDRNNGNIKR